MQPTPHDTGFGLPDGFRFDDYVDAPRPDTDPRSAILFAESLVPEAPRDLDLLDVLDIRRSAELMELWLIAEIDAAIEALVDGAEVFTVGELVRSTPTPKTGQLPGLVMVHYERRVDWTEPAGEDFTIEDAETDDEDGEDWEPIPRSDYTDVGTLGAEASAAYNAALVTYGPVDDLEIPTDAKLDAACNAEGCDCLPLEEYTPRQLAAFADSVATKLDRDLGLEPCGDECTLGHSTPKP